MLYDVLSTTSTSKKGSHNNIYSSAICRLALSNKNNLHAIGCYFIVISSSKMEGFVVVVCRRKVCLSLFFEVAKRRKNASLMRQTLLASSRLSKEETKHCIIY